MIHFGEKMRILIIGNGGREHALAWKVAQSPNVTTVFVAPGNAGTAMENKTKNVSISATNISALIDFCKSNTIDLAIVGPEAPLALGIVDEFQNAGIKCFGPSKKAVQLEASKKFAKEFMVKHHIPTASYQSFTEIEPAKKYIQQQKLPIVIKADGLAAGKGVIIAQTQEEAFQAVENIRESNQFGEAGHRIVIEEFITGEEASYIVVCDGKNFVPLVSSQDHKNRDNGDKGPNTGGMGAYSPAPIVSKELEKQVLQQVIQPVVNGMLNNNTPFIGFLYAGLMINANKEIKVLEFNCRLGDPEAEVLLFRLQSDLVEICLHALEGKLDQINLNWDPHPALGVVLASTGYPDAYKKGWIINGLEPELPNCKIFHAGTELENNNVVSNGGRVLCVCAKADTLKEGQALAYQQVKQIDCPGLFYRSDIGFKGLR